MLLGLLFRKNIKTATDVELVNYVKQDRKEAEGELFQRYSILVFGLCLKYFKNKQLAEDMTMNIFEKLHGKIKKSEISNFKSWLYSVARNECLMELRKNKVKEADIDHALITKHDEGLEELKLSQLNETKFQLLEKAVGELKDEQKQCIELFYLKRKSYDEVSNMTGFDLKKVKSYIQNGKRNLKIILERNSEFFRA
ncbi:MAG: sigma-70 family RNA polymerase sigma factor [Flavobacteriales bacterium]|nr:sigma-70 family RNA polymerase sigma factor [Flavobacteriales bacterium]